MWTRLPEAADPVTHRVHTSYLQTVAATGRLASNDPNLQNIPIRTEKGREIRKAFVPRDEDHQLLSADYSQIELRIIAHMSGDHNMQEAFRHGLDIHAATAAKVFNVDIATVTRDQRSRAKAVNFGIAYGQGAFGLCTAPGHSARGGQAASSTTISRNSPGAQLHGRDRSASAARTATSRPSSAAAAICPISPVANNTVRAHAERIAINAPMQGTAADIIKVAMVRIHRELKRAHEAASCCSRCMTNSSSTRTTMKPTSCKAAGEGSDGRCLATGRAARC